jgi:hypothetical protein
VHQTAVIEATSFQGRQGNATLNAFAFDDGVDGVCGYVGYLFVCATGPQDLDLGDSIDLAEAKVQAQVTLREVAIAGVNFVNHLRVGGAYDDARSDGGTVAFGSFEFEEDAVVLILCVVQKNGGRILLVVSHKVDIAVVIDISEGHTSPRLQLSLIEAA